MLTPVTSDPVAIKLAEFVKAKRVEIVDLIERAEKLAELLPTVRGVIFPSRFAVRTFMEAVLRNGDARSLARMYASCIATCECSACASNPRSVS